MSEWKSGFSAAWANTNSWLPGATLVLGVASLTAIAVGVLWAQSNASEARLAAQSSITKNELMALITEKSASLAAEIKETGNKSSNDVNEARQRFLDATMQVTKTTETLGKTAGDVARLKEDLEKTTNQVQKEIPGLTISLNATESRLKVTDSHLKTTINSFNEKLVSINDKIQASKSHEEKYIESFGLKVDKDLTAATIRGRILAVPQDPFKFETLRKAYFYQTTIPIGAGYGWAPTKKAFVFSRVSN
jgi:hypothetical protein